MKRPLVSFVIPVYNSERTIGKCVESVLAQRVEKEVIVIDDGSTDRTGAVIRKFGKRISYRLQKNSGPATARNVGKKRARGRFIAFIDADVVLPKEWAKTAVALIEEKGAAAVGGPGVSAEDSVVARSLNLLLYGKPGTSEGYVNSLATMDALYAREALEGMSFDESFTSSSGEDPDLNFRLVKSGKKLLLSSRLWVEHDHPTSLGGIVRKWYKYGKHYPLLYAKHKELRGKEYYARISYFPLLMAFLLLSPLSTVLLYAAVAQLCVLWLSYAVIGIRVGAGAGVAAFATIHSAKQMAQLAGTTVGLRKLL